MSAPLPPPTSKIACFPGRRSRSSRVSVGPPSGGCRRPETSPHPSRSPATGWAGLRTNFWNGNEPGYPGACPTPRPASQPPDRCPDRPLRSRWRARSFPVRNPCPPSHPGRCVNAGRRRVGRIRVASISGDAPFAEPVRSVPWRVALASSPPQEVHPSRAARAGAWRPIFEVCTSAGVVFANPDRSADETWSSGRRRGWWKKKRSGEISSSWAGIRHCGMPFSIGKTAISFHSEWKDRRARPFKRVKYSLRSTEPLRV